MVRSVQWLAAISFTVLTFGFCLWLFRFVSFHWLPQDDTDRWVVATAFATVAAGAVGAAGAWWAGQERHRADPSSVHAKSQDELSGHNMIGRGQGQTFESNGKGKLPLDAQDSFESVRKHTVAEKKESKGTGGAVIVPFPGMHSWDTLTKVLRETSLDSRDWAQLTGATSRLREELAAPHAPDESLPESVPILAARLGDLLTIVTSSSTPPPLLDSALFETRQTIGELIRFLTEYKG